MNDPALAMAAFLEGGLSPGEIDRLAQLIREDPAAAEAVSEIMMLDTHLRERKISARQNIVVPMPTAPAATETQATTAEVAGRLPLRYVGAFAAAAALIVAALIGISMGSGDPVEPAEPRLASVVYADGVRWDSLPAVTGEDVVGNRVAIRSGKLDLMMRSGAQVAVSGDTELWITDPMRVTMRSGRARIVCPSTAVGFTVALANGVRIEDLGTEFELRMDETGIARLFVHDGSVAATDASGTRTVLDAGSGFAFDTNGQRRSDVTDPWLRARLAIGELRRDTALATLIDASSSAELDAQLHGAAIVREGDDDAALAFAEGGYAELTDAGVDGSLTVMAWIKPTRVDAPFASLVMTPSWVPGGVHFQIKDDRLKLNLHSAVDFGSDVPIVADRWQHVAATVDLEMRIARLYVNGRLAGESAVPESITPKIDGATIGAWLPMIGQSPDAVDRTYTGEIDDLVILNRAVSPEAIASLYRETQTFNPTDSIDPPPVAKEQP